MRIRVVDHRNQVGPAPLGVIYGRWPGRRRGKKYQAAPGVWHIFQTVNDNLSMTVCGKAWTLDVEMINHKPPRGKVCDRCSRTAPEIK